MKARQIAYIIWTVIALLGVVCLVVPDGGWHIGTWHLRFPTLTQALDMDTKDDELSMMNDSLLAELETLGVLPSDSVVAEDTIAVQDSIPPKAQPVIPEVNVSNTDSRAYLAAFYAALDSVRTMPVRVVHYGDSQIEEDRITNVLRERWQKAYGGGGVGLLPLHQTIPTRSIRQWLSINGVVQTVQGGPKRYLVYGPRSMRLDNDEYGVMGQVAVMDSTLVAGSEDVVMCIEPIDKKRQRHNYFNRVRVFTDSVDGYILAQDTMLSPTPDTRHPLLYTLPDSTTKCEIHLQGKGKVYGVSLETPTGVIVDNIPMRGCSGNIFTKIDSLTFTNPPFFT